MGGLLGHDGQVPRLAMPPIPAQLEEIVSALGVNRVKVALLAALARAGGHATTTELAAAVGLGKPTVSKNLASLQAAGLVSPDRIGTRGGAPITWSSNAEAIASALDRLREEVLP